MRTIALISWRFLVVTLFAFWQGGFLFYTSVVVPMAQGVIGDLQQGFITRKVTVVLNVTGVVVLGILALDAFLQRDPRRGRRFMLWFCWVGMALCQAGLFWFHPQMEALLDPESWSVLDRDRFRPLHRIYLWLSTVQWGLGVLLSVGVLAGWRRRDFDGGKG